MVGRRLAGAFACESLNPRFVFKSLPVYIETRLSSMMAKDTRLNRLILREEAVVATHKLNTYESKACDGRCPEGFRLLSTTQTPPLCAEDLAKTCIQTCLALCLNASQSRPARRPRTGRKTMVKSSRRTKRPHIGRASIAANSMTVSTKIVLSPEVSTLWI